MKHSEQTRTDQPTSYIASPAWIIPCDEEGLVLRNHSVVVLDGIIHEIGETAELKNKHPNLEQFCLDTHALIPGFVNAHGHAAMTLFRGMANDLPLMEWLNDHIWPAEGKWVNPEFVHDGTLLAIAEMLKCGTTTFSDMYFFPNIAAETAKQAGIRAQLVCPVLDFPMVWASDAQDYIKKAINLSIEHSDNPLIRVGLGPHAPYTVSDAPLANIREIAQEYDIPIQIHLHETQFEVDEAVADNGIRPIKRLQQLGLISEDLPLQCVHMTALNDDDIKLLKNSSASVIHCPESNLKLASGFCDTQKLIDANINVALGTDGAASNNDLDIMGEMRTAALIAKPVAGDASALDAPTALRMATLSGAEALGIADITGSITLGKSADLVAIDLSCLNSQPSYDPIADIVYACSARQVSHVWVAGQLKVADGELTELDESKLIESAQAWRAKIKPEG